MAAETRSWLSKLNIFNKGGDGDEIKSLKSQLEATIGEFQDVSGYDTKFLDTEPSGFNTHYSADYSGIDQQLDAAALQRLYTTETWVYTAVTEIAKTIGSLPQQLQKKQKIKKTVKNPITGASEVVDQVHWIDASGEPLFQCFERPNKWCTKSEWLMLLTIDLLTAGEYFIYLDSDLDLTAMGAGEANEDPESSPFARLQRALAADVPIKGMYRIPPPLIKPIPSVDKSYIEGYAMQSDKGVYAFNFAEVIHVKLPNPNDPYRGLSPLVAAFKPVLLDRFSTEHMVRFYKTGARLGGVIETEKSLNKEQLGRFQRTFEGNFTGRKNHHRTLVLPPGMSYKQIAANPAETSLLEFCRYNREAILSVYHVPPIKVGIMDNANYANARVQLQIFFTDTIKPILSFIEDGYNLKNSLMPEALYRMKFDLSDVEALKEDYNGLAAAANSMMKAGLTINEVRELVWKKPALPKGDRSFNIAEIDKMENGQAGALVDTTAATTPEAIKDGPIAGIGTTQNPELIHIDVGNGKPKKPEDKVCAICGEQPCKCPQDGKTADKPSLGDFIKDALAKLDASEPVTAEFLAQLVEIYNEQQGIVAPDTAKEVIADSMIAGPTAETAPGKEDIVTAPKAYAFGWTKDQVVEHWKSFIHQTDPLVSRRHAEVSQWFKSLKSVMLNRVGANIKSYGLRKARDEDDINEILDLESYRGLIADYIKQIDRALDEAYRMGYMDTLTTFKFEPPNITALKYLKQYGADEVTKILETTREQMKTVLSEAFEEGVAMGEVATRLQEKFAEIEEGRAWTIARTETLSAVSAGQEQKRQDFEKQFPNKPLKKAWVSAQDERVRDSHQDLDGEVVEVGQDFSNGLQYPREQGGAPEEIINCRCTTITYAEEDQDKIDETLPPKEGSENLDNEDDEKALKGGPGSGRRPTGRKPKPTATGRHGLSVETANLVAKREAGKGEPVKYTKAQLSELLDKGTFALISAGRNPKIPDDVKLSDKDIKARYDKLESDLKASGYAYTTVEGHYSGKEDSFLVQVHEANRAEMLHLGEKYNQDSVIYTAAKKNEMVFTTGPDKGKKITGEGWSWQDHADDFYTEVTHSDGAKSKFQLNFNFEDGPKSFQVSFST